MILSTTQFSDRRSKINEILWDESTTIHKQRILNDDNIKVELNKHRYEHQFLNFPVDVIQSSDFISCTFKSLEVIEVHDFLDAEYSIRQIEEILLPRRKTFDRNQMEVTIENYIDRLIHNMVYSYDEIMKNTFQQYYFVGIDQETKILLTLLNQYEEAFSDNTQQIQVFSQVSLSQEIADIVTSILIDIIKHRLNMLTISNDKPFPTLNYKSKEYLKLNWNGTQQQLCELIVSLEEKKWISKIENGERKKIAESITSIFNLDGTKRNAKSDPTNSFYQLLKGDYNRTRKKREFSFLQKENYQRMFNGITKNAT